MITFRKQYFLLTILLFTIEALIALFLHDRIIRPYVGDFLVVILIYCFVRTFFGISVFKTALGTLLFAYMVELLQYLNLIEKLGLQNFRIANLILGNLFQWIDLVAYTLGIATIIVFEKLKPFLDSKRLRPT
jgi:hypothetical protein